MVPQVNLFLYERLLRRHLSYGSRTGKEKEKEILDAATNKKGLCWRKRRDGSMTKRQRTRNESSIPGSPATTVSHLHFHSLRSWLKV